MSSGQKPLLCHVIPADEGNTCLYIECDSSCSSSLSLDTVYTVEPDNSVVMRVQEGK
jgi:hypothetical protein